MKKSNDVYVVDDDGLSDDVRAILKVRPHAIVFTQPSLTDQSSKAQCDIGNILNRYVETGMLTHVNPRSPLTGEVKLSSDGVPYYDFTSAPDDYRSSVEFIERARQSFAALPAAVRYRFGNDPGAMLRFLSDPSNRSEAVSLGLVDLPPPPPSSNPPSDPA